jgi:hypothetical protein
MLKITRQDEPERIRLQLEGDLSGPWVGDLEEAWRGMRPALAERGLWLDMTAVGYVDPAGRYLLALLRCNGAHVIASGTVMTEFVLSLEEEWPVSTQTSDGV